MAKRCLIEACKREVETHCYHCSQDVCGKHFLEHKKWTQEQLPSLIDEVNFMYDRLRHNRQYAIKSVPQDLIHIYNQLDKWHKDSHQHIDTVYDRVRSELDAVVENRKSNETQKPVQVLESLEKLRQELNELIKEDDLTYRQFEAMKQQLDQIKRKEQEPIKYPTIHIVTKRIDVNEHVNITLDTRSSIDNEQQTINTRLRPSKYKSSVELNSSASVLVEESINKCPVCFMNFPLNMTSPDRERHVTTHFLDN